MAKKPDITTIASGYYSRQALNTNFENLQDGFDNTLSLDGSTPNSMGADFDVNGNNILNAGQIATDSLLINGVAVTASGDVSFETTYLTASYTGDGSTVAYSLTANPQTENNVNIYVDGVYQNKTTFSLSGTTVTFSEAPPLNAAIEIVYPTNTDTLNGSNATAITYNQGGTGAQDRNVAQKLQEFVSVKDFGAVGDGVTDDRAAIQAAVDSGAKHVVLPAGYDFIISSAIELPSDFTFEVNGDLILAPNTPDDMTMVKNSDRVNYQNNIHITGTGRILGNKANQQTGVQIRHTCIDFKKVAGCTVTVAEVGSNKWDNLYPSAPASGIACAIQIHDCRYCRVSGVLLYEWEHEGINLDPAGGDCYGNIVENCTCEGSGAESYSGIQVGGIGGTSYNNIISNCIVRNCGASAIGLDSTYSVVTGCTVWRNGYFHGINLGHSSAVADYSTVSNCSLFDIGNFSTTTESNGINVGNGTKNVTITNCNIKTVHSSGIYLSTGESCAISNCRIDDTGDHAIKLNLATGTKISNIIAENIGGSLVRETGSPNDDLWYEVNETVFKRYGSVAHQGTFTPVLVGSSVAGDHTYSVQSGFYERHDRVVTFRGRLVLTNKGTISGNLTITGLPFTSDATANSYGDFEANIARNLNITAGQSVTGFIDINSTTITVEVWDATTGSTAMTDAELTNTSQLFFSGVYQV